MSTFKELITDIFSANKAEIEEINAKTYKGLPKASKDTFGVAKVDGVTVFINENGEIAAKAKTDNSDMKDHMENSLVHVSKDERDKLEILKFHIDNENNHFQSGEKKTFRDNMNKALKHIELPHLSSDQVKKINEHIIQPDLHFDDHDQKHEVISAISNSVKREQKTPFKILITNEDGIVILSDVDARKLLYLQELTDPIGVVLSNYASIDHTHEGILTSDVLESHSSDLNLHFKEGERKEIDAKLDEIGELNNKQVELENNMKIISLMNTQRKVKVRYIRDTLLAINNQRQLEWMNCAIYKNGKNIASNLSVENITSNMGVNDLNKLAYVDGDTSVVSVAFEGIADGEYYMQIDLGAVMPDISHIHIHHGFANTYDMRIEVSENGEDWIPLYDTEISKVKYEEDAYGKIHITNYEAYVQSFPYGK